MGNSSIKKVNEHKHLGLVFTSDLLWHPHIKAINCKACRTLGILKRQPFNLNRWSLTKIYTSFVRPLLEYADITRGNYTVETQRASKVYR